MEDALRNVRNPKQRAVKNAGFRSNAMIDGKSREGFLACLEGKKAISLDQAHQVLTNESTGKRGFVKTILDMGLLPEETVTETLSDYLGLEQFKPGEFTVSYPRDKGFSPRYLRQKSVLPLNMEERHITVAMLDPFDSDTIRMMSTATGRRVEPRPVTQTDLRLLMDKYCPEEISPHTTDLSNAGGETAALSNFDATSPAGDFIEGMFTRAVKLNASDIHIEHKDGALDVRFRIDGILEHQRMHGTATANTIVSRLKILAEMDIAEKRLPQDGRARMTIGGRDVDLRFASLPSQSGETLTIRLLSQSRAPLDLGELGFSDHAISRLRSLLQQPNGLILVTGPTGSGKTTTLYAALQEKVDGTTKIMSIEDPVEYDISGVTQVAVKPSIGLTFPRVLRSAMRHDPDVILVGEIRDQETAEIAIRAALTGHLVLATLHANSAADAVTRLIDMGIPRYMITAAVRGALAQRLVRRLADEQETPKTYAGRAVIAEVLMLEEAIRQLVLEGAIAEDITFAAENAGMLSMAKDGLQKIRTGITTIEEVSRVSIGVDKLLGAAI